MNKIVDFNDAEEMAVVRSMFDPYNRLSNEQIKIFLHTAKQRGLDPRLKQICLIPKVNKKTGKTDAITVTQIDGFRLIAERTGKYAPGRATEYSYDANGNLLSATAYVKKMTSDGQWHEVAESAYLSEYDAGTYPWKNMPHVMIAKCAEARSLRRAFPDEMSGLYTNEEMDQAKTDTTPQAQTVDYKTKMMEVIGEDLELYSRVTRALQSNYGIDDFSQMGPDIFDLFYSGVLREKQKELANG